MKKAIYKITNKINKKSYIGQSVNPILRFEQHNYKNDSNSLIHKALKKYGREHFSLQILGWYQDYNEKEKYFIKKYSTLAPKGYNILQGGNEPPHYKGEKANGAKLTEQQIKEIKNILKYNWNISIAQISHKYQVSRANIHRINLGIIWFDSVNKYPLRPSKREIQKQKHLQIVRLLQTTKLSHKQIAKKMGCSKSLITMINTGKMKDDFWKNYNFPIRK